MSVYHFDDNEIEKQFRDFMSNCGFAPADNISLIMDGKIHRYKVKGDKHGDTSGSYCIYTDGTIPAGWAGDWHYKEFPAWHYDLDTLPEEHRRYYQDPERQAKIKAEQAKREEERKQRQIQAAGEAMDRINTFPNAPGDHPYLQKKGIYPYGVKLENEALAVPLRNLDGLIRSYQRIYPDGSKRFFTGAPLDGLFWAVGLDTADKSDTPILIGEGYATMAKIYELTNLPSVMAINCGHLPGIAEIIHKKYPKNKIIIMADNDKGTELKQGHNPGIFAADSCVKRGYAVSFIAPEFDNPEDGTDWDDFALKYGDERTARILNDKIHYALIPDDIKAIKQRTEIINSQDLRNMVFPPVKWAVEGFLPSGLSILAGGPKVGKSILALHLSVGVAIGGRVLSSIDVQKGEVLYLALEDTLRRLQQRINSSDFADAPDLSALDIVTRIPRQHEGGLKFIDYWLNTHSNARLVIIDTLQMFRKLLSGKGSMYSEDYEAVSEIKRIADKHDVPFLVIHHLKKGMEGDWLSEISGSQGIAGAADTIFSLKRERNSNVGTLHRTGRDVEEKDFEMKLDGFGWVLLGEAEQFTTPEWKRQILDFLKDNPSITPMQLSEVYHLSLNTAQQNLRRLAKEGMVKKTGHGKYELESK